MASLGVYRLTEILSKPPETRPEFETRQVAVWLHAKVKLFKDASEAMMNKLVSECYVETKSEHEMIIMEGDVGNCMYILISGRVDVHQLGETEREQGQDQKTEGERPAFFIDRTPLGPCIAGIGPGAIFGEVALIEDCRRTASIVAAVTPTQVAVVPRALYESTIKVVIEAQFRQRMEFINTSPHFVSWNPRNKKQLAMGMEMITVEYESEIVHQGDALKYVYFIQSGEVCLSCDPTIYVDQYFDNLSPEEREMLVPAAKAVDSDHKLRQSQQQHSDGAVLRNKNRIQICLLGGDASEGQAATSSFGVGELLSNFPSYMFTAMATRRSRLLALPIKHFDRLIIKRNLGTLDSMRPDLHFRLQTWISRCKIIAPFLTLVLQKTQSPPTTSSQPTWLGVKRSKKFNLPPRGPLIDLYGPGTAFHYIREQRMRMEKEAKKVERLRKKTEIFIPQSLTATPPPVQTVIHQDMTINFDERSALSKLINTAQEKANNKASSRTAFGQEMLADPGRLTYLEGKVMKFMDEVYNAESRTKSLAQLTPEVLTEDLRQALGELAWS